MDQDIRRQNRQGYRLLCAVLASIQILLPTLAAALPTDGHVVAGHATIHQDSPATLSITQASDKAILNWNSFSIAGNEAVHFLQPSVSSIALNRVIGVDPSVILGQLQANGQIFLINPNGILFGAGAQIDVGGLFATTLQTRDEDFMAGRYLFAQDPLNGLKTVVNRGHIHVSDNGYVVLMAPGVSNEGVIVANLGTVLLGSGQKFTLDLMGDGLIRYAINDHVLGRVTGPDGTPLASAVSNSGSIQADGGHVILQAKAAGDIFSSVVNQSGVIRARSLTDHGGVVRLLGGDETLVAATSAGAMRPSGDVSGAVVNTGMIDVAAGAPNAARGSVTMVGERVGQFGSIMATGADGANGGEVVIASTTRTLLASGSAIDVSGLGHSSGGRLRVWSDQETFFNVDATILARGGELGGNGGFVEISGKENLAFAGRVDALAPFGSAGTLLLDPRNITIRTAGGVAYDPTPPPPSNNLFSDNVGATTIITPASINGQAANVVLQANRDITITNAIFMINDGVGITMQAGRDIRVNNDVSTTNGNISMTANDSTSDVTDRASTAAGDIIFGVGDNLSSGTGNITLTIDPATAGNYAPGSIINVRNLTTTTGNISMNSPQNVTLSGAVDSGSGTVTINANNDGVGGQDFTMNAGSSIATTNTPVAITVNSPTGGTGAVTLRNISTGSGFLTVVTNPGANTVGGGITQVAGTSITAGGGAQLTTGNGNISLRNITTNNNLLIASRNLVSLNGAVDAGSGTVSINANSDGAGAQAFTMNAGSSITTTNSLVAITVNTTGGGTGAATLRNITTGTGALTVATNPGANIVGGGITQVAGTSITAGGATQLTTGNGNISLRNITTNNDLLIRSRNTVQLSGAINAGSGTVTINANADGASNQFFRMNAGSSITTTNSGANAIQIVVNSPTSGTGTASLRGSITTGGGGTATVSTRGQAAAGGNTTGGAISQGAALTINTGASGNVALATGATTADISLNTAANDFTGSVGVSRARNVTLRDANALDLGTVSISGNLAITAGGAVTDSGNLSSTAAASTLTVTTLNNAGAPITLDSIGNNFANINLSARNAANTANAAGAISYRDVNAVNVTQLRTASTAALTTDGVITQTGAFTVTGTTSLTAGAGNNITLTNAGNNFTGAVSVISGNNVSLRDTNALALGTSTVSGALALTTGGALSQSGALNVMGATLFIATAANTDILLGTQANNFGGALSFAGALGNFRDVSLRNVNAGATVPVVAGLSSLRNLTLQFDNAPIILPTLTLTAGGNLNVTAGGTISQSGEVTVPGATTLATTVAGSDILLNSQPNNLTGAVTFAGIQSNIRDVGLRNVNAGATIPALAGLSSLRNLTLQFDNAPITLPTLTLTAGGNLNVTSGGTISQSGVITVPGATTLATTVAGSDILLNSQPNNLTGAVTFTGIQSNIRDVGLRNVSAGATVPTLAGLTNLRNLTLRFDSAPVTLPALTLTAGGSLNVTAGGAMTDSGNLIVPGTTTLVAGANDITLDNANDFTGAVSVISGNNVTLTDVNALDLGTSAISGTLDVTTNGTLTQSGALSVTGATTLAAGAANSITLNNAGNNFSTVAITSGNNVVLTDVNALDLGASTVSGNLFLTTGGTLSQSGALAVIGTTSFTATAAGSDILLATQANNFGGALSFAGTQANVRDVQLRNVNAGATMPVLAGLTNLRNLTVTFDNAPIVLPALTASGNLTATAGGLISQSGALNVAGAASFDTTAAATLGSVNLANSAALTLNTSTVGGNLTATTSAGDLTLPAGQTLTIVGDATLSPAGAVNLLGTTRIGGTQSSIGGTGSTFVLGADTNLNALPLPGTGNLTVNTTGTTATFAGPPLLPQAITLNNAGNNFGGPVSVTTAAPAFTGTATNTYNLTQSAAVGLNPGQGLTVTDLGGTAGTRGNIALTNPANSFNTVNFTGGNIAWAETGPVTIGTVNANAGATSTGALAITTTGPITQTGALAVTGTTTLAAGAANNITLTDAANNFGSVGITSGNNVALTDATALDLGASTVSGNLALTTGGTLSQTGALNVTGTTSFTATAANTDILLATQANNFGGALSFAGTQANVRDVQLRNVNAGASVPALAGLTNLRHLTLTFDNAPIALPTLTASGNLDITSGGSITQSGVLAVGGTTTLATTVVGSDILLDTQANNLGSTVSFGGTLGNIRDVGLRNVNTGATIPSLAGLTSLRNLTLTFDNAPIALPSLTLTAGGNLNMTAGGSISQSGVVTVPGTTTLATTVAGSDILLHTQANNFTGTVAFGGTQTNIRDIGLRNLNAGATNPALAGATNVRNIILTFDNAPIALPNLTASGDLSATAGGTITQTGALTIAGITTLATGINDIILTNGANNFSTVGITSGNNVSVVDSNALELAASTVSGNLSVTTVGALTQSGALTVAGATTLVAGANDITLNSAGNNFSTVGVTSGNNVTLADANALTITASTVSGNFSANAGDLTVGGPVVSTGGNLNLTGANTVTQLANLTANGANSVTVTATTGPITMAATATTTSGTGGIDYTAGTDVTLGSLSTGGGVNVSANGGSVLSAAGSGTNVTAGANSTLQAFNGVVGTQAAPVTVNINPSTLSIRATTAVAGISAFLMGTVLPSNALMLLNVPLGLVCFNGCPVTGGAGGLAGLPGNAFGTLAYLNPDAIVPAYYPQPSRSVLISDITSVYMPAILLQPSPVSLSSGSPAVQSMEPKANAGVSCNQAAAASSDVSCSVQ